MRKKIISLMISGILVSSMGILAFAEPLTEEQQKSIDTGVENLTQAEKELAEVQEELTTIDTEIGVAQSEINLTNENIEKKQKEIDSSNTEIETLKVEIDQKKVLLGDRLNSIYKSGGANSYLQLLLSADSLDDFLGRSSAVNKLVGLDKKALEEVESKKEQLERKVSKLENDKKEITKLENDNKKKVEELSTKKVEMDKVTKEYEEKCNSADIDLFESEKAMYDYWRTIIENSNSSIEDIEKSLETLKQVKEQVKSNKSKEEIGALISKGEGVIKTKKLAKTAGVDMSAASGKAADLIAYAYKFLGYPYVWGANGPDSFDCSGFTRYVYKNVAGIELPRVTYDQQNSGVPVSADNLQPGDLILTRRSSRGPEHVGIYIGNGKMIHASNRVEGVKVGPISQFDRARRLL